MRTVALAAALVCASVAAACGDSVSPESFAGEYTLVSIDATELPHRFVTGSDTHYVFSERLVVERNTALTELVGEVRRANGSVDAYTIVSEYATFVEDDHLVMLFRCPINASCTEPRPMHLFRERSSGLRLERRDWPRVFRYAKMIPWHLQPGPPIAVHDCEGPATSLPAELAATLEPRKDYHPDHVWADIAEHVPGGFAGIMAREGQPILLLTDSSQAAAAKEALVQLISGFPIRDAAVEQVRWNFSQLVNWYDYLGQHTSIHTFRTTSADKSEADNRIIYGWADSASLYAARDLLESLPVPCRLVLLEIRPPARALPGSSDH